MSKVRLPSKEFVENADSGGPEGGYVGTAQKGVFSDVGVLDYTSEYPMVICEFNISPDTYEPNPDPNKEYYVSPNGNHYVKDKRGILPRIMDELYEERVEVKKEMREAKRNGNDEKYKRKYNEQRAIKVLMNSFYGLLASSGSVFRLANEECSKDITAFARAHIKFTAKKLEEKGYTVLYSDTDSVFLSMKSDGYSDIIEECEEMSDYLNETYTEFCDKYNSEHSYLNIEPDKIYKRWIQGGSKKRYAGLLNWEEVDMRDKDFEERLEVKGFEVVRANNAEIMEKTLNKIFRKILTGESKDEIREYLKRVRKEVFNGERDFELGVESEAKPIEEYKTLQAHAKAYVWANKHGYDLKPGDPYLWWYDEDDTAKGIPVFEDEMSTEINIDYDHMWKRNVVNKIKPVMDCIVQGGFKMNMFLEGRKQKGLSSF